MKTPIKMIIVIVALFMNNLAWAGTDKPFFQVKNSGEKVIHFETKEMTSTFVEVLFQNEKGETLFSEYAIRTIDFERKYNLSELENGTYFLTVKSDNATQVLPISIANNKLEIDFEHLETIQ